MPRSSRWAGLVLAFCAVGAVGAASTSCGDRAKVYVHLERTAVESSASGSIQLQMDKQRSTLRLRVQGLLADTEYLLLADGVLKSSFTTDPGGDANLRLQYPASAGVEVLDFDPRGKLISVSDGSQDRLSAVVDGPGEPAWSLVVEEAGIPPTDTLEPGQVRGIYQTTPLGCRMLKVSLRGVTPGTYQVQVDGALVGEVEVVAGSQAKLRLQSPAFPGGHCVDLPGQSPGATPSVVSGPAPLDFEPRGAPVEVLRDGAVRFEGPMRADVAVPVHCPDVDIAVQLAPAYWFGAGDAVMQSKDEACDHEFRVEARSLPVANYELWVAGEHVGTVPVRSWTDEPRGEVRFDSDPDEPGELPLDFDPRGQTVEVRRPIANPPVLYLGGDFPTE